MQKKRRMTLFVSLGPYLCINKNDKAMSKEVKNWIENFAELEALIDDLDLEFTDCQNN